MTKHLNIVKEIREFGLEAVVEKYKLNCKEYPHKVLLKYDQIESHEFKNHESVRECRGLVLEKESWKVLSYMFNRFFNRGEYPSKLDYAESLCFKKEDGSCIGVYWDSTLNKWETQTTGTADGNTNVGEHSMTFRQLFEKAVSESKRFWNALEKGNCYAFELCSPYNIVVTPHTTTYVKLLAVRNLETCIEYTRSEVEAFAEKLGVDPVEVYYFDSLEALIESSKALPQVEEGYIMCSKEVNTDGNLEREKVKNPAYVALHHLKGKLCQEELFTVIFKGEEDEFLSLMPEYKDSMQDRNLYLMHIVKKLSPITKEFLALDPKTKMRKEIALWLQNKMKDDLKSFMGTYFAFLDGKVGSLDPWEILKNSSVEKLDDLFKKWNFKEKTKKED